ncbi:MAG: hypothetical protein ACYDGY_02965 [Acidimicrobiales bacterium]
MQIEPIHLEADWIGDLPGDPVYEHAGSSEGIGELSLLVSGAQEEKEG